MFALALAFAFSFLVFTVVLTIGFYGLFWCFALAFVWVFCLLCCLAFGFSVWRLLLAFFLLFV